MRRWLAIAALSALGATLSACSVLSALADELHSLTVVNRCLTPNTTVNFWLDDIPKGTVTYSASFTVLTGTHSLRAVGTGAGSAVFEKTARIDSDSTWTLCPS
jgi:hypothetical protein